MGVWCRLGVVVAALLVIPTATAARAAGTWSPTGSMAGARGAHTASLLPGGKVLVAGGRGSSSEALASAELYDAGTWSGTGRMAVARSSHTATVLPGGKVLVAGGNGASGPLASAELYDPATGAWSGTGNMATARVRHTATVLPGGRVLVAGGDGGSGPLASAELYDPATGTWSDAGSMTVARIQPTAMLLPGGKVLVAGGDGGLDPLASAELYDPATGTWTATGAMTVGRFFHTATLLPDGRVLAAGGYIDAMSAELYDPTTGSWSSTASMAASRYSGHTATPLADGTVLLAGGTDPLRATASAEVYVPATGEWSPSAGMTAGRAFHTATRLPGGTVLVAGGDGVASAELYRPDDSPPATAVSVAPPPNAAGWNSRPATVTLTATDEGGASGVRDVTYRATGAQPIATTTVTGTQATVTIAREGVTTLSYFARDKAGNAESTGTVVVRIDLTAPALATADMTVPATTPGGALVRAYTVSATDNLDPAPAVACRPPAPHRFPIGPPGAFATVVCTATDHAGNTTRRSLRIHVAGAAEQITALRALLARMAPPPRVARRLDRQLAKASNALDRATAGRACAHLRIFASLVDHERRDRTLTAVQAARLTAGASRIAGVLDCRPIGA